MRKSRSTNPKLLEIIEELKKKRYEEDAAIWRDVAKRLSGSAKNRAEINVGRIARNTDPKDIILVPGKVLGSGRIDHPVTTAALEFSVQAKEKMAAAGGKCLTISELAEQNPKGKGIRIME